MIFNLWVAVDSGDERKTSPISQLQHRTVSAKQGYYADQFARR